MRSITPPFVAIFNGLKPFVPGNGFNAKSRLTFKVGQKIGVEAGYGITASSLNKVVFEPIQTSTLEGSELFLAPFIHQSATATRIFKVFTQESGLNWIAGILNGA